MKIRSGFVSNSSTSSFCVFGVVVDDLDDEDFDDDTNMDAFELMEEKAQAIGLEIESTSEGTSYVIGVSAQKLPMDKTLNEMKTIISEKLKSLGIKFGKIGWHEEAWYDG